MGAGTSPAGPASAGPEPADPQPVGPEAAQASAPGADDVAEVEDAPGDAGAAPGGAEDAPGGADDAAGAGGEGDAGEHGASEEPGDAGSSRRFPSLTLSTARPEGGGRAAPGDAPAPARQWPLLTVLCTAGAGLLIVAADPFTEAFRIGAILMGIALLAGAGLRWVVPSVGMLAVRSRFTDLVTYGLMGTLIVLLALMAQPKPWLDIPILEDVVHFTVR